MERTALSEKIMIIGVDGLDPRFSKHMVEKGKMPNLAQFIHRGSARKDLAMLGGHPTITPPMWTTLATGCWPYVHGITDFNRKGSDLDYVKYNIDSRLCEAEQLWNVFAESGKKTLVFHWPGSSWPPSSDSKNLYVVDGTSPGGVCDSTARIEDEYLVGAGEGVSSVTYAFKAVGNVDACIVNDVKIDDGTMQVLAQQIGMDETRKIILNEDEGLIHLTDRVVDVSRSPIKDASGWIKAPESAKEFTMLVSGGLIRRMCLILKNEHGEYDHVAVYKSKKDVEPLAVLTLDDMVEGIVDEVVKDDEKIPAYRSMRLLDVAKDGSSAMIYVSAAMRMDDDDVFHPKRLYKTLTDSLGFPPPTPRVGSHNPKLVTDCLLRGWESVGKWEADAIHKIIADEGIEVVFSHFHCVDLEAHNFIRFLTDKGNNKLSEHEYLGFMEDLYKQADRYLGRFLHFLDEGWTVLILSDHGQVCSSHDMVLMGDCTGVNVGVMEELGLTTVKKDEKGNRLHEIDWEHTLAVAQRSSHIYVNLKGRDPHGIVDPKDKYEVEEEIMTRLYGYRDKKTGKRIVALAVRNKDAVHFGLGGPESGDVIYFLAEGYQWDHGDSLSTSLGEADTSVSPIFVAAGKGIKCNYRTNRVIREIDIAPTVAALGGMRYPLQCEGAPVYQILNENI